MSRSVITCLVALFAAEPGRAQTADCSLTDLWLGYGFGSGSSTTVKVGQWAPIGVQFEVRKGSFRGKIVLTTVDSDGNDVQYVIPNVAVAERTNRSTEVVYGTIRVGKDSPVISAQLVETSDSGERVVHSQVFRIGESGGRMPDIVDSTRELVAFIGDAAGLYELRDPPTGQVNISGYLPPAVTRFRSESDLPLQWYGYGGVTILVLGTSNEKFFDRLDPQRASAIRTWVRQGGRLVVSVGKNWQLVSKSFLAPMLPATIVGVDDIDLRQVPIEKSLESFAGGNERINLSSMPKMAVAKFERLREPGRIIVQHAGRPIVYSSAYGLGQVTLIGFDVGEPPFRDWKAAKRFWVNALKVFEPIQNEATRGIRYAPHFDEASRLNHAMEDFPDVTVVPFHWVALLIFLYILLIGPIDYFFLKKVVKRLELTWITFPTWVILISVAAYYSAYMLKGDDLRLNRVEIVDVDASTNTLRGTGYLCVFSPRIARYNVAYTSKLADAGPWSQLPADVEGNPQAGSMGEDQTTSVSTWFGTPDLSMRGIQGDSGASLIGRRQYGYVGYEGGRIVGVAESPIQVWSTKSFTSSWIGRAQPVIDSKLRVETGNLRGELTNILPVALEDVMVAFNEQAWIIQRINPQQTIDLAAVQARGLSDFLRQGTGAHTEGMPFQPNRNIQHERFTDIAQMLRGLIFYRARGDVGRGRTMPCNHLSGLDLSHQWEVGRIILLGRVDAEGGSLWLNDKPVASGQPKDPGGKTQKLTFLRVVIDPKKETQ
jgi:hypothetical protein